MKKKRPRSRTAKRKGTLNSQQRKIRKTADKRDQIVDHSRKLTELFLKYNPHDVCIALNVSDLWIPNVASQVRHIFAFRVLASLEPSSFSSSAKLESYSNFCDFLNQTYKCLPTFPTLEDYVPETDWGEIRIFSNGAQLRLLYGSSIERLPDFIEAPFAQE
jgi:hypothetical protein